jgi:two-component system, chemotaxis family, chemotaxis protein CheY
MNILCIDDSMTMRKILAISLKDAGHTVIEAANGQEGLDKLGNGGVDCIILDVNMPIMGGIEFLGAKSRNPHVKDIPVIVMTTQDETSLKGKALGLGARGFIAKPFDKTAVIEALAKLG